jgi:hypothetical protein
VDSTGAASFLNCKYTGPKATWTPYAGPVTFGLSGGVSFALDIVLSGTLLTYKDNLSNPTDTKLPVPPHSAYVRLTLNMSLNASVSGSGSFSGGAFGVKGSATTNDTYAITFSKAFDPSTKVQDAIVGAFQGFVLPLHPKTLEKLDPGDYLMHDFDGKLNLSFGATYGIDQVLYAEQVSTNLGKIKGTAVGTLTAATRPEIKVGAGLNFTLAYETRFQILIGRQATSATLRVFRSSSADATTAANIGLTFNGNSSASIKSNVDSVMQSLVNSLLPSSTPAQLQLSDIQAISTAQSAIQQGVTDANNKVASWLKKADNLQLNLQWQIESIHDNTILTAYTFNLSKLAAPQLTNAWTDAINGNFEAALVDGGGLVTLQPGSGLEKEHETKTSFTCKFFNLWSVSSWTQWKDNVTVVYVGNNTFHLLANIGRQYESDYVGASKSINFYCTVDATEINQGISAASATVHLDLDSSNRSDASGEIATLLNSVSDVSCSAAFRQLHSLLSSGSGAKVQLAVSISAQAFRRVLVDPYKDGRPATPSGATPNDQQNFELFTTALDIFNPGWMENLSTNRHGDYLKTFAAWQVYSAESNGVATRIHPANTWPQDWVSWDVDPNDGTRTQIRYYLMTKQDFMQLCALLSSLYQQLQNPTDVNYKDLLNTVDDAMKTNESSVFPHPATLTLIWICRAAGISCSATATTGSAPSFQGRLLVGGNQ